MEEINISDLLSYFKSKLVYILLITLVVTSVGIFYKLVIEKPVYKSSISLILTGFTDVTGSDTINNNDLTINQKLITTYQEITKSRKVLSQVIEELDLEYEIEDLANNVTVAGVTDTEIIKITVNDRNPLMAYQIVDKIADVFSDEVRDIYNVSNVSILDVPEVADEASNMGVFKFLVICIFAGLLLGCLIIFVIYYFDTTIKTVDQIEAKLDVPVLGSIPDYNIKRGRK